MNFEFKYDNYVELLDAARVVTFNSYKRGGQPTDEFLPSISFEQFRHSLFPGNLDLTTPYQTPTLRTLSKSYGYDTHINFWKSVTREYAKLTKKKGVTEAQAILDFLKISFQQLEREYFAYSYNIYEAIQKMPSYINATQNPGDLSAQTEKFREFICLCLYSLVNYDANSAYSSLYKKKEFYNEYGLDPKATLDITEDYSIRFNMLGIRLVSLKHCLDVHLIPELYSPFNILQDADSLDTWRFTQNLDVFTSEDYEKADQPVRNTNKRVGRKKLEDTDSDYKPEEILILVEEMIRAKRAEIHFDSNPGKKVSVSKVVVALRNDYPESGSKNSYTHPSPIGSAAEKTLRDLITPLINKYNKA